MNDEDGLPPRLLRVRLPRLRHTENDTCGADERDGELVQEESSLLNSVTSTVPDHPASRLHGRASSTMRSRRGVTLFSTTRHWSVVRAGPGVARRALPGTPYLTAGMVLTRTITYDARGRATLHTKAVPVTEYRRSHAPRSRSLTSVASSEHRHTMHTQHTSVSEARQPPSPSELPSSSSPSPSSSFLIPPAPWSPPSFFRQTAGEQTTTPPTSPIISKSQAAHHSATALPHAPLTSTAASQPSLVAASYTPSSVHHAPPTSTSRRVQRLERHREVAEQQHLMEALTAYPLLSVLPPRTAHEQRYTDFGETVTSQNHPQQPIHVDTSADDVNISIGQHCDEASSLRATAWGGCRPASMRASVWRLLCGGYAPASLARQARELDRKRTQYADAVRQYSPLATTPSAATRSYRNHTVTSPVTPTPPGPGHAVSETTALAAQRTSLSSAQTDLTSSAAKTASAHSGPRRLLYYQQRSEEQRRQAQLLTALGAVSSPPTTSMASAVVMPLVGTPLGLPTASAVFTNAVDTFAVSSDSPPQRADITSTSLVLSASPATPHSAHAMLPTAAGASSPSLPLALTNLAPSVPSHEKAILNQLALDLPRHRSALYHSPRLVNAMARCLFLWSQRHPAVGYVQGMDEVIGVFFTVFLTSAIRQSLCQPRTHDSSSRSALSSFSSLSGNTSSEWLFASTVKLPAALPDVSSTRDDRVAPSLAAASTDVTRVRLDEVALQTWPLTHLEAILDLTLSQTVLLEVEADCYHCGGRLLSVLQANYTASFPGITRAGRQLEAIVARAGGSAVLDCFAQKTGMGLRDGCHQWLHCLLARELPLTLLLPLWDTYLAVGDDHLMTFHVCVCAALVLSLEKAIRASPPELTLRVLQRPFEVIFPDFPREEHSHGEASDSATSSASRWNKPLAWLDVIIADGYRLWKQCT